MLQRAERFIDKLPFSGKYGIESAMKGYIKCEPGNEGRKYARVATFLGVYVLAHAYQAKMGIDAFSNQLQHFESTGDPTDTLFMGFDAVYAAANAAVTFRQFSLLGTAGQIRIRRLARNEKAHAKLVERAQTLDLRQSDEAPGPLVFPTEDLRLSSEAPEPIVIPTQDLRVSELAPQPITADAEAKNTGPKVPFYKRKLGAVGLAATVTLGGQVAMLVSYGDAVFDRVQDIQYSDQKTCITQAESSIAAQERTSTATVNGLESYRKEWSDYCGVSPSDITPLFPRPQTAATVAQQGW